MSNRWRFAPAVAALAAILTIPAGAGACAAPRHAPTPITVIGVGPLDVPSPRTLSSLIADPTLLSVVEAHVVSVDALRWHRGESITYPYSLVHLAVDREWKQPEPSNLAVRVFGGMTGDRKYVSAIQPDPVTLTPSTHVLLFVSPPSEIDPGVRASTVEVFFFVDGDRLLRFDRTPTGESLADVLAALDLAGRAAPSAPLPPASPVPTGS